MTLETQLSPQTASSVTEEDSLLEQAIGATKQTTRDEATLLIDELVRQAQNGVVRFDRNLRATLESAMRLLDKRLSDQLAGIMHEPSFLKLEGSWRGLHYLVSNSRTGANLKIRVMNVSRREFVRDMTKDPQRTELFKHLYDDQFDMAGGEPFGALIGDYEFTNHPEDISTLKTVSNVAAAAFTPFISATGAAMFGLNDFRELRTPRDLEGVFKAGEYSAWRSFRESEDSAFVTLTMPRVLARTPYGSATKRIEEFDYEESPKDDHGRDRQLPHESYCWMNAAYVLGARLTQAFALNGWCTAIRGAENGGKVEDLPTHQFYSDDGDFDQKCPTEVGIGDRRDNELAKCGFMPLVHYKNTDYAVFFSGQTCRKAKKMDTAAAFENEQISTRLPYVMAVSRFAHYMKILGRDKIGSGMEADDITRWLTRWVNNYVNGDSKPTPAMRAKYPLREAKVLVAPVRGRSGAYHAVLHLRPWLQMEELTASLRLVADIPSGKR